MSGQWRVKKWQGSQKAAIEKVALRSFDFEELSERWKISALGKVAPSSQIDRFLGVMVLQEPAD